VSVAGGAAGGGGPAGLTPVPAHPTGIAIKAKSADFMV